MTTADVVLIIVLLVSVFLGLILGFGKGLKLITSGILGKIISIVVCYFLFGVVLNMGFVQDLLDKLITALKENGNGICNLLIKIRIDLIVLAVALFLIVQILRKVIVSIIKDFFEIDKKPIRVINKVLGVTLFLIVNIILVLTIMQVSAWIGGTDGAVYGFLEGSKFGLDKLFINNPLNSLFETIQMHLPKTL